MVCATSSLSARRVREVVPGKFKTHTFCAWILLRVQTQFIHLKLITDGPLREYGSLRSFPYAKPFDDRGARSSITSSLKVKIRESRLKNFCKAYQFIEEDLGVDFRPEFFFYRISRVNDGIDKTDAASWRSSSLVCVSSSKSLKMHQDEDVICFCIFFPYKTVYSFKSSKKRTECQNLSESHKLVPHHWRDLQSVSNSVSSGKKTKMLSRCAPGYRYLCL